MAGLPSFVDQGLHPVKEGAKDFENAGDDTDREEENYTERCRYCTNKCFFVCVVESRWSLRPDMPTPYALRRPASSCIIRVLLMQVTPLDEVDHSSSTGQNNRPRYEDKLFVNLL